MLNMALKKMNNKKGVVSIVYVILAVIIITIITAFLTMNKTSFLFNEIQSVMDSSATTALTQSVDKSKLKEEKLAVGNSYISNDGKSSHVDKANLNAVIRKAYLDELSANINKYNIDGVVDYELAYLDTKMEYTDWGVNATNNKTGVVEKKKRPQLLLDSVVKIKIKSYADFDSLANYSMNMYNAYSSSNDINISVSGRTEDGEIILVVRTFARVVYR